MAASRKMGERGQAEKLAELDNDMIMQPTAGDIYGNKGINQMDTIHVRIPKRLRQQLEKQAAERGYKFSYYVRYILNQAVDAAEKE